MTQIKMYGTTTCKDCVIAKEVFKELKTDYEFINMENDKEATDKAIAVSYTHLTLPTIYSV